MPTNDDEAKAYLDKVIERRGYVLESHKLLAKNDLKVLQALDVMRDAAYADQRILDKKTKELILLVAQTAIHLPKRNIQNHIKLALDYGATPQEILEAIELLLPDAGIPTMFIGIEAWAEVVGAEKVDTSFASYEGGVRKAEG